MRPCEISVECGDSLVVRWGGLCLLVAEAGACWSWCGRLVVYVEVGEC